MPLTPGRPHSPNLHPRTRTEANEYALRARATGDWFRHDGKNVEVAPSPPTRLTNERAHEFANKNKGEPDQWYQHDSSNPTDPPPAPRQPTADSKQYSTKIYGRDEPWYKHDDNRNYFSPRPKDKLTAYGAEDNKEKIGKADSMDWYRHDHAAADDYQATPPRHRTPQYAAETTGDNADRVRPTGSPGWANYENGAGDAATPKRPPPTRLTAPGAGEFLDRNRQGNVDEWFGHHPDVGTPRYSDTPRVGTLEGQEIAVKNRGESEKWYDYDANRDYRDPQPGGKGSNTHDMVERSRGGQMERILRQEERGSSARSPDARVKPEARDTADKNLKGVMDKFLNQDLNADYHSARPGPRVRPEASETFEKNKGMMTDCMQGHPAPPPNRAANRVKPEAQEYAVRNKGIAAKVISDPDALPTSSRPGARVKPEAAENAERNKGTMASLLTDYGGASNEPVRAPRLKTDLARELAERNRGTVGSLFGMGGY